MKQPRKVLTGLLLNLAEDNDRRSIGNSNAIVEEVLSSPELIAQLFAGLQYDSAIVRLRTADALEKVSLAESDLLQPYAEQIIELAVNETQHEVRWHFAQIIPRLHLSTPQKNKAIAALTNYLEDKKSTIVRTWAMDALFRMAQSDRELMDRIHPIILERSLQGKPAERARARKLLKEL